MLVCVCVLFQPSLLRVCGCVRVNELLWGSEEMCVCMCHGGVYVFGVCNGHQSTRTGLRTPLQLCRRFNWSRLVNLHSGHQPGASICGTHIGCNKTGQNRLATLATPTVLGCPT